VHIALLDKQIRAQQSRALIGYKDPEKQETVLNKIIASESNGQQTEEYIQSLDTTEPKKKKRQPQLKGFSKDIRIAMNTIRQSLNMVSETGIDVEAEETEQEEYYQFTIKIPKQK